MQRRDVLKARLAVLVLLPAIDGGSSVATLVGTGPAGLGRQAP